MLSALCPRVVNTQTREVVRRNRIQARVSSWDVQAILTFVDGRRDGQLLTELNISYRLFPE